MTIELRKTGISVVGDIPWGTHFCHFYETKEDLLDILIPYFKTGLENNEFCMWVVSDPLGEEEARNALRRAVPEADWYLAAGRIEIVPHTEWYLEGGGFVPDRVTCGWSGKLAEALAGGYAGIRVNGSAAWVTEEDWKAFSQYEETLDETLGDRRIMALCSYPLCGASAAEILHVVHTHQFAVVRRRGNWEVVESSELKQAKAEIKRLNEELEQRVVERTRELAETNEELRTLIAERQRVEESLRESEERFSKAFRSSPITHFIVRLADGCFLDVNHAFSQMFGYEHAEVIGRTVLDLGLWVNPQERQTLMQELYEARAVRNYQTRVRTKSGDILDVVFFMELIELDGQQCFLATSYDVTERKRVEEALQETNSKLELILSASPLPILGTDADGRIITWNEAAERLFGWTEEEAVGHMCPTIPPGEEQDYLTLIHSVIQGEAHLGLVRSRQKKSGALLTCNISAAPQRNGRSEPIGITFIVEDITERKRAEEHIRATTEQLRALSASLQSAREEEGARIARELHDELGSALTSLKWDLEGVEKLFSEAAGQTDPSTLREKVEGMTGLIDATINTVKRISSELRPSILDDLGLVEAIEWQAQKFEARTGTICRCDSFVEDIDLSRQQATSLFHILREALTNILRHAQATRVNITLGEEEGELFLRVRDNGRGILEEERTGSRSMGLIGMRERALLIGGKIEITGVAGKGTVLTVRVPLRLQASD